MDNVYKYIRVFNDMLKGKVEPTDRMMANWGDSVKKKVSTGKVPTGWLTLEK